MLGTAPTPGLLGVRGKQSEIGEGGDSEEFASSVFSYNGCRNEALATRLMSSKKFILTNTCT